MKVGLDLFSVRELEMDRMTSLDYAKEHGYAGVQGIGMPPEADADLGPLKEFHAHADSMGLYTEVSVDSPNPHSSGRPHEEHFARFRNQIRNAHACGWRELHGWCGGPDARQNRAVPWQQQLNAARETFAQLAPELRDLGARVDLEPKGGLTTREAVALVEDAGPDIAGICLDVANTLCFCEHPTAATERVAPYTNMTHCKDAIVYFCEKGLRRQVRPSGGGVVNWPEVLGILHRHKPDLNLSIEDHKWLYDIEIFTPEWHQDVQDVPAGEICSVVNLAWRTQQRIEAGEITDPEEYEAIPYTEQLEERLASARDHLNTCKDSLGGI